MKAIASTRQVRSFTRRDTSLTPIKAALRASQNWRDGNRRLIQDSRAQTGLTVAAPDEVIEECAGVFEHADAGVIA